MDPRENLKAYLDGELTLAEQEVVEAQLQSDPSLAQELAEIRAISTAIRAMEPTGSVGLEATLLAVKRNQAKPLVLVWSLSAAACLVVLSIAFGLSQRILPISHARVASFESAAQSAPMVEEKFANDLSSKSKSAVPSIRKVNLDVVVADPQSSPDAAWNLIAATSAKRRMEEEKPGQLVVDLPATDVKSVGRTILDLSLVQANDRLPANGAAGEMVQLVVNFERSESGAR